MKSPIIKKAVGSRKKNLDLLDSLRLLESCKIPVARYKFVKKAEEANDFCRKIGYPVVLKAVGPDILHKTELGAVIAGIKDEKELDSAFTRMHAEIKKKNKKAVIFGFVVQQMAHGQELLVGGKFDIQFHQVLVFGLGGIFTEVFDDVSMRVVPVSPTQVKEMISEIKGYKILRGYRGIKYDLKGIEDVLSRVSKLLDDNPEIKELDINPLFVSSKGAVAADARVVLG